MKVRDAALLRTEKVEKQKAEVEAARDKLKRVPALDRLIVLCPARPSCQTNDLNLRCSQSVERQCPDALDSSAGRTWRA